MSRGIGGVIMRAFGARDHRTVVTARPPTCCRSGIRPRCRRSTRSSPSPWSAATGPTDRVGPTRPMTGRGTPRRSTGGWQGLDRFSDRADVDAAAVLTRIGEVSPYFRLEIDEGSAPLAEFYADDDAIRSAVRRVGLAMDTEEFRTAASTFHIGVVARLWSITLGAMVLTGTRVVLDPARIFYSPTSTGITLATEQPQVLALDPQARAADGTISETAATDAAHALDGGHLGALAAGLGRAGSIAHPMLRGNTVATVFGAGRMIDRHLGRPTPPEFTEIGRASW